MRKVECHKLPHCLYNVDASRLPSYDPFLHHSYTVEYIGPPLPKGAA